MIEVSEGFGAGDRTRTGRLHGVFADSCGTIAGCGTGNKKPAEAGSFKSRAWLSDWADSHRSQWLGTRRHSPYLAEPEPSVSDLSRTRHARRWVSVRRSVRNASILCPLAARRVCACPAWQIPVWINRHQCTSGFTAHLRCSLPPRHGRFRCRPQASRLLLVQPVLARCRM